MIANHRFVDYSYTVNGGEAVVGTAELDNTNDSFTIDNLTVTGPVVVTITRVYVNP